MPLTQLPANQKCSVLRFKIKMHLEFQMRVYLNGMNIQRKC